MRSSPKGHGVELSAIKPAWSTKDCGMVMKSDDLKPKAAHRASSPKASAGGKAPTAAKPIVAKPTSPKTANPRIPGEAKVASSKSGSALDGSAAKSRSTTFADRSGGESSESGIGSTRNPALAGVRPKTPSASPKTGVAVSAKLASKSRPFAIERSASGTTPGRKPTSAAPRVHSGRSTPRGSSGGSASSRRAASGAPGATPPEVTL